MITQWRLHCNHRRQSSRPEGRHRILRTRIAGSRAVPCQFGKMRLGRRGHRIGLLRQPRIGFGSSRTTSIPHAGCRFPLFARAARARSARARAWAALASAAAACLILIGQRHLTACKAWGQPISRRVRNRFTAVVTPRGLAEAAL